MTGIALKQSFVPSGDLPKASNRIRGKTTVKTYWWVATLLSLVASGCTNQDAAVVEATSGSRPNILLIIGDDLGVETLSSYGIGDTHPRTVALDEMARQGVRFSNFWSQPVCSPTRATMLTGRYGFRTGIGRPVNGDEGESPEPPQKPSWAPYEAPGTGGGGNRAPTVGLPSTEYTLPMAFRDNAELGYSSAAIGKWHLADSHNGWERHPIAVGFDAFSGSLVGSVTSFFAWNKVVNGQTIGTTKYPADDKVDDAIAWIDDQGDRPWFLWFSFNLPHTPVHLPPESLWQTDHSSLDPVADLAANPSPYFGAMIEAMDTAIGRLLDSLEPEVRENTYVIFLGDNGTDSDVVSEPYEVGRAKGTVYQGGVHVPLIVTGPGVERGSTSQALVNSTDLFSTILEMAGIDVEATVPTDRTLDSVSFLPYLIDSDAESHREWIYADVFPGNFNGVEDADYALRNARYKFLRHRGNEEFYDLSEDPFELNDLLDGELSNVETSEYQSLRAQVMTLRDSN